MSGEPAIVHVAFEERYWYPTEGGQVWLTGYQLVDSATGDYIGRNDPGLRERGLLVASVAGVAHNAEAVATAGIDPGATLELRRDPGNPHDANAIAVHAPAGEQLGWVPRELAADLAPEIDSGTSWSAVVLRERRASPRDPRRGLTMLLASAPAIELRAGGRSAEPDDAHQDQHDERADQ